MSPIDRPADPSDARFLVPYPPRLPRLRAVQSLSAGVDELVKYVPTGAVLCNAKGVHDASTADLPDHLPRADIVVLTVPLTQDTRGLVDADFLALMPDGALLVNVSRGAVVDTDALLAELRTGRPGSRWRTSCCRASPDPDPGDRDLRGRRSG